MRARFPVPERLADFFRMDQEQRVPIAVLARLLGASDQQVRQVLRAEGMELSFDSIAWGEAATCLFDAWPRAQILAALGPQLARRIPAAFHPAPVQWGIPIFILRAIEHQAASMPGRFHSSSVDDYVADILFNEIQPTTVADLAHDSAFVQAYYYPPLA